MIALQQVDARGDVRNRLIGLAVRRERTRRDVSAFRLVSLAGAVVTIGEAVVYRGGVAIPVAQQALTITASSQWAALQVTPGAEPDDDEGAIVLWTDTSNAPADHDGLVVRGLWKFALSGGVASPTLDNRAACELAMMGH